MGLASLKTAPRAVEGATLATLEPEARALLCTLRAAARSAQIGDREARGKEIGAREAREAAAALMAAVDAWATRPMVFHARNAASIAFGEAWAMSLLDAFRRNDAGSAAFLIGRCIAKPHRRTIFRAAERLAAAVGGDDSRI